MDSSLKGNSRVSREHCYRCNRIKELCLCADISPLHSQTKYIILMHPKEARKIKNGTGRLTHLSLQNSELIVGVDFTHHRRVNKLIATSDAYLLYPSSKTIDIVKKSLPSSKNRTIFLLDATWASAKKMLRESKNLQNIAHISFTHTTPSQYQIKEQPNEHCLSTIESTLRVLELLEKYESYSLNDLQNFLDPFFKMNTLQLKAIEKHATDEHRKRFRQREKL